MKSVALILAVTMLTGCAAVDTVKKYWPKSHDPVMFNQLVSVDVQIEKIDCTQPTWNQILPTTAVLARHAEWRSDPQSENLKGLHSHVERMNNGGSKVFCELGKKTAKQRINAAKSAWEGR
jgi:hypothetical protein